MIILLLEPFWQTPTFSKTYMGFSLALTLMWIALLNYMQSFGNLGFGVSYNLDSGLI